MNEVDLLKKRIELLESVVNSFVRPDAYTFRKPKIGFYSKEPVSKSGAPTGRQDKSGSGGANITDGTGYNGNTGSTYYTVGDIVYVLKLVGLID